MEDVNVVRRVLGESVVYIGEDLSKDLTPYLRTVFEEGTLLCLYDEKLDKVANSVMHDLKRAGYRILSKSIRSKRSEKDDSNIAQIPEYVRYILAIGAGSVAECAKDISIGMNIDWSIVLSAPSTDCIMQRKTPKQVFIDKNILINCPIECIASGYGILLSVEFSSFEDMFKQKILSQKAQDISICNSKDMTIEDLAYSLIEVSYQKKDLDSADYMARILYNLAIKKGKRPHLLGEYKFLSATLITAFYREFLGALCIDVMPPANMEEGMDRLVKLSADFASVQKVIDFFDINSYFRISYILGEYRMDLLEKLNNIDMHSTQRFWRRLYHDAGYWLKAEIDAQSLLKCMSLAGACSDNLLGYAYASGVMTKF